jgi:BlaI family penicillinase repressor
MSKTNISESEWIVMEVLWDSAPQTSKEVTQALRSKKNWAANTVRTLLTRLVKKGALKAKTNPSDVRIFSPKVSREACVRAESESFMERLFGGAAKPLLVHFAKNSNLSAQDVEDLKRLLDESVKRDSDGLEPNNHKTQ